MYRQGLGDCFLVTFDVGRDEKHLLIDCGTLGATTTGVSLATVVKDVRKTTRDHLDLLVATHEHWDHVAGFDRCRKEFEAMDVDHVWLAWTEDPNDDLARRVRKAKQDLGNALAAISTHLAAGTTEGSVALGHAVSSVLGFFDDSSLGAGAFSQTVDAALEFVRTGVGVRPRYCRPGDGPFEETWLSGFRFYVLGPPRNEEALYDLGKHGSSELYSLAAGLGTALPGVTPESADAPGDLPFDVRFRCDANAPATRTMFAKSYLPDDVAWRRIDDDWLQVIGDLALQLDSATNNTSLALAIERVADGKVLLFPGDAQQGNWLSWHDSAVRWTVGEPGPPRDVDAADLLARTVFYKVGHHASHNATVRDKGLELMAAGGALTAFIPVDRKVALGRHPVGSWKMPARALYRRLLERCGGLVARSDIGWASDPATASDRAIEKDFQGLATASEWAAWKAAQDEAVNVTVTPTHVDYVLE